MFTSLEDFNGDVWSNHANQSNDSVVARSLLPQNVTLERKKKSSHSISSHQEENFEQQAKNNDSYPNTNTKKVDWALVAAHRAGSVLNYTINNQKKNLEQESNFAAIFLGQPSNERFKDDQRSRLIEKITLETILLAMYMPIELCNHLMSFSQQYHELRLAVRQCNALIEAKKPLLLSNSARERDLLIKKILFFADNAKTECSLIIEAKELTSFSKQTLCSVSEADLFGRAIGVLVHNVLQSPSLRVYAGTFHQQKIELTLSWATALENIKCKDQATEKKPLAQPLSPPPPPPPPPPPHLTALEQKSGETSVSQKKISNLKEKHASDSAKQILQVCNEFRFAAIDHPLSETSTEEISSVALF